MSDPILEALGAVRSDLAAMRLELMGRIDRMVSREEHRAEIKRLDSLHVQAAKDLADHETSAGDRMAAAERIERGYLGSLLRLTLLAPGIVEAVLDGRGPANITLPLLLEPFPTSWSEQRPLLNRSTSLGAGARV